MLVLLCSLCFIAGVKSQGGPPPSDGGVEFDVNFLTAIYTCPDELSLNFVDGSQVELVRYNESVAMMKGAMVFKQSFDLSTMMELVLEKEANGRFEMVMTHEIPDVCEEIGDPGSNYAGWIKYFGLPDKCPFEPGVYQIHDLMAETDDLPINSANAGEYQATMNFYNCAGDDCENKSFLGCVKMDFCIEPK